MRTISVPITLINLNDDGFHLLLEITAFGNKSLAVIDTGASRSVFDKRFIEDNSKDFTTSGDVSATTLFTTSSIIQAVIPKLKLGKLTIKKYPAVALDLDTVNQAYVMLGHPRVIAIIGSDIFYKYEAKINYKKMKVFFSSKPR